MIITLCGSARFESYFKCWNEALTLAGHTVYSLAVYPSDKKDVKMWYTEKQKIQLDKAHKNKIKASDAILVLNVLGYIGDSTISEIEFAKANGKEVYALESWGKGCGVGSEHFDCIQKTVARVIPEYKGSPIDMTTRNDIVSVWELDLGEFGPERGAIVDFVCEHDNAFTGMPPEYR